MPETRHGKAGGEVMQAATFDDRIAQMRAAGFDVAAPTGPDASSIMLQLEADVARAGSLRARVLTLPERWSTERDAFLAQLAHPGDVEAIEAAYLSLLRQHRPWVLAAERARIAWSDEGRTVELARFLERLDDVDESLINESSRLVHLIEGVAPRADIENVVAELERRQTRRTGALEGMCELLAVRGWDVSAALHGPMHGRFDALEALHQIDAAMARCQAQVEADIRPFDALLAERLVDAILAAQRDADSTRFARLEKEIIGHAEELAERLLIVERRLNQWMVAGYSLGIGLPLLPGELLTWEARIPLLAKQVEESERIWARIDPLLDQWPEHRLLAERTKGLLDNLNALAVLLEGLESKTAGVRDTCRATLAGWAEMGFHTEAWMPLLESQPRALQEELQRQQRMVDLLAPLMQRIRDLDLSCNPDVDRGAELERLAPIDISVEAVEAATRLCERVEKRNERHRRTLDLAKADLRGLWPAELDASQLDLAAYEEAVTSLETRGLIPDQLRAAEAKAHDVTEAQIDAWSAEGWEVSGLRELLVQDPVRLGLDMPAIRAAIAMQPLLAARLEPLPWSRDPVLAERVMADLSRPERLPSLATELPDIVARLAEEDAASEEAFTPFTPDPPKAKLTPLPRVLKPSPEVVQEEEDLMEFVTVKPDEEEEQIPTPMDVRVQRLARIRRASAALGDGDAATIERRLDRLAKVLQQWTGERLSRRHESASDDLLSDAHLLGRKLEEIPGPSFSIPLGPDGHRLPADFDGLMAEVDALEKAVRLPLMGGAPEAAASA